MGAVEKLFSLYHISGWEWGNQTVFGREADRIPDVFLYLNYRQTDDNAGASGRWK